MKLDNKAVLELKNINKNIGNQTILHDINLKINRGEFFALLGPSGCGKSTLLRMIAGFDRDYMGEVIIDGMNSKEIAANKRPVNMVFQSYALFPHLNVRKNISFGLEQDSLPKDVINSRIKETAEILKIDHLLNREINELSGGQQQRVALARSLVKRPQILLLDEPMGALDIKTRETTQLELLNLQHMLGITFLMVTHNQQEAISLANKLAVMNNGRILQYGTPREVYDKPNNKFVADFIGRVNFIGARIIKYDESESKASLLLNYYENLINVKNPEYNIEGEKVSIALRPEEIHLSKERLANYENYIIGKLIEISFAGYEYLFYVKLTGDLTITVSKSTAAGFVDNNIAIGDDVYLSWHEDDGVILAE